MPKPRRLHFERLEGRQLLSINITGLHHEQIKINNPGNGTLVDLTGGTFLAVEDAHFPIGEATPASWPARNTHPEWESSTAEKNPVSIVGSGANIVVNGGTIQGLMDPLAPWHVWKEYSDGAGVRVDTSGSYEIRNVAITNVEDGIDPRGGVGATFNIHDVFMNQIHDDMVENDEIHSGTIANSFMRGHTFLSQRGSPVTDPNAVVHVINTVVELMLQPHMGDHGPTDINGDGGYPFPDGLGNGSIFKWDTYSGTVDVRDSVFLVNRPATSSYESMEFPPGTYTNVTVVWLGDGPWPAAAGPVPSGVTITTNRAIYDQAVSAFFAAHSQFSGANSTVAGRFLFYKESAYDDNGAGGPSHDRAIASDKSALLPGGGQSTFANLTSYIQGINGLMVDLSASVAPHTALNASDFTFRVSGPFAHNDPNGGDGGAVWAAVTTAPTVNVRLGVGAGGSDRVEITWPNGAIKNTWLEVTVKANSHTGLVSPSVFYFGNLVGDSGMGNDIDAAFTDSADVIGARAHQATDLWDFNPGNTSGIASAMANVFDYNRDNNIDATDIIIARANQSPGELDHIDIANPPHAPATGSGDSVVGVASALSMLASARPAAGVGLPVLFDWPPFYARDDLPGINWLHVRIETVAQQAPQRPVTVDATDDPFNLETSLDSILSDLDLN